MAHNIVRRIYSDHANQVVIWPPGFMFHVISILSLFCPFHLGNLEKYGNWISLALLVYGLGREKAGFFTAPESKEPATNRIAEHSTSN